MSMFDWWSSTVPPTVAADALIGADYDEAGSSMVSIVTEKEANGGYAGPPLTPTESVEDEKAAAFTDIRERPFAAAADDARDDGSEADGVEMELASVSTEIDDDDRETPEVEEDEEGPDIIVLPSLAEDGIYTETNKNKSRKGEEKERRSKPSRAGSHGIQIDIQSHGRTASRRLVQSKAAHSANGNGSVASATSKGSWVSRTLESRKNAIKREYDTGGGGVRRIGRRYRDRRRAASPVSAVSSRRSGNASGAISSEKGSTDSRGESSREGSPSAEEPSSSGSPRNGPDNNVREETETSEEPVAGEEERPSPSAVLTGIVEEGGERSESSSARSGAREVVPDGVPAEITLRPETAEDGNGLLVTSAATTSVTSAACCTPCCADGLAMIGDDDELDMEDPTCPGGEGRVEGRPDLTVHVM